MHFFKQAVAFEEIVSDEDMPMDEDDMVEIDVDYDIEDDWSFGLEAFNPYQCELTATQVQQPKTENYVIYINRK